MLSLSVNSMKVLIYGGRRFGGWRGKIKQRLDVQAHGDFPEMLRFAHFTVA